MMKHGILNSDIAKVLADLGHTDQIIICDAGLPVPAGVPKIDVALALGVPSFNDVLSLLEAEMVVEKVVLAEEIKEHNPRVLAHVASLYEEIGYVSHEEFKRLSSQAKAIIRTGENTPYANIILQAGVLF
ncbi:D-ribose pyranase [Vagococcus salmoninarum]|uniref:D-ribose pyranase n=1 Tax=Vagococcus salmoninarum TaxID=2739 RepID=A0A429ZS36_9ENTE|nr:D-ribose pyranase [Vagococcus salmoninarum]RST96526.1 D-ribose pyranase [Vagococcus salmoninarum]